MLMFARTSLLALLSFSSITGFGQSATAPSYPKGYFRNPLSVPITLAGNFGECRPGHFHSGIDLRTNGVENLPVFAAADGYISRIKTEKGGFGHAIYITHPNGYTTLYAHLNKFYAPLQKHLRKAQYEKEKWDLDISFTPDKFPVKKGQQIAFSGNTGASAAPHLHFEIRDSKTEHPLNPQLFGFEVKDTKPPVISEIAFYRGNIFDRDVVSFTVAKKGETYKPLRSGNNAFPVSGDTVEVPAGKIGLGFTCDDFMEGSDNTITFRSAELEVDKTPTSSIFMDDIGYDVSRYLHGYADYYARQKFNKWIQLMFRQPGNRLPGVYASPLPEYGKFNIAPGEVKELILTLTDNSDNRSQVRLFIKGHESETVNRNERGCKPFYYERTNDHSSPNIRFSVDDRQLYDDICISVSTEPGDLSDRFQVHYPFVPLHHYTDLQIKSNRPLSEDLRSKVVLMYNDGKKDDAKAAQPIDNMWYKASVRNFGNYWLDIDTTPPVIRPLHKNGANLSHAAKISFIIKDATTSVRAFRGTIDGKWGYFEPHGSDFFYEFDEYCKKGRHELEMTAEDENGNKAVVKTTFIR